MSNETSISRRRILQAGALGAAATTCGGLSAAEGTGETLRFVHLTDIHIQPELEAERGFRMCLAKVNALDPKPAFVVTGGDLVMDVLAVDRARAETQWSLFLNAMKELTIPVYHTLGNHDVFGWTSQGKIPLDAADYGKKQFMDRVGEGKTYRSFDVAHRHFVLLDSVEPFDDSSGYKGYVNEEQLDWLTRDLEAVGKERTIVMVSHIPMFSVWGQVFSGPAKPISPGAHVTNAHLVRKACKGYRIPLVLQGHNHIRERIEYMGTTYMSAGAVSGAWWRGVAAGEHPEGFTIVDLHADGTFTTTYETYGWKAVKP